MRKRGRIRDGKESFYRTLYFDKETWKLLTEFRKIKYDMLREPEKKDGTKK